VAGKKELHWWTVQIPSEMVDAIRKFIDSPQNVGYASVAEFVRDAVRRRLDDLRK
jgi:Arc/MetJ-type ribon-helix-helix transcriptional regulator